MHMRLLAALLALPSLAFADSHDSDTDDKWDVNAIPGEPIEIPIDTTTGTWMSLDVSPDGETIAFDLLGDIYTVSIDGGDATPIHSGLSWSMQPRFSPDGERIAFTSDAAGGDNIWIMNADGSDAEALTSENFRLLNNPYWSPDGDYIVARKHFTTGRSLGTGEIWMYHVGGGSGVQIIERPNETHQKELGEPAWSPDGRYVYFSVDATPGPIFQYAQDSNGQIFVIRRHDLETGETEDFVTGPGGAVRPEPSPDGRYLAFVRRIGPQSALFLKDLTSGEERPVFTGLDEDLQEVWGVHGLYPNYDWLPDASGIVFWAGGGIHRLDIESGEVAQIPFRVKDTRVVYEAPVPPQDVAPDMFNTKMVRGAAVSPDGSALVFESLGKLYVRSLPDGTPKRLTRDSTGIEYDPSWSADGRSIAYVRWTDEGLGHIRTVRSGGGRSKQVTTEPGHYQDPVFTPDGDSIIFEREAGGYLVSDDWSIETGLFEIPVDGGRPRLVTDNGSHPQFAGDPDRLFVTRRGENGRELVSIDRHGGHAVTHARGELVTEYAVSGDGRHLAYRENYQVFVVPLPSGGKPLTLSTSTNTVPMQRASGDGGNYPHWADGRIYWSLGPELMSAGIDALFAEDGGYEAPRAGISMAMAVEADRPEGIVALDGARIITMADQDGGVIERGTILIDGNRITAVGENLNIPSGAEIIDVSGKTIVPGFIDAHAHSARGLGFIPEQNWIYHATLAFGVTTMFDPSHLATEIFAAAEMQRAGEILAPRIFSTGEIVYGAKAPGYFAEIDSLEDARQHVRRLKAQGAISVKNYNQPRREQRQMVTTAAREENMHVVSEGGSLYHMDLSMVADGNSAIEHNLPQSMLYDDVLQFWSQTKVHYTPTLVVTYGGLTAQTYWEQEDDIWKHPILSRFVPPDLLGAQAKRRTKAPIEDYHHITAAQTARQLADLGVGVSIGAHGQREGLASHWEMWGFAQGGMSPVQVLRTSTIDAARKLGMHYDLGSLEEGKLADLVILNSNPLENIYETDDISHVMLNGRLYDALTLDEEVTGDHDTKPFYWQ